MAQALSPPLSQPPPFHSLLHTFQKPTKLQLRWQEPEYDLTWRPIMFPLVRSGFIQAVQRLFPGLDIPEDRNIIGAADPK